MKLSKALLLYASLPVIIMALTFAFRIEAARASAMISSHYSIQSDSLNFGGAQSTSASYSLGDTLGEIATGMSSSTHYAMFAGYQQMQLVNISVTPAASVVLSPSFGGVTGGTANGSTNFTVVTDDPAGYTATIQASTSPALVSGKYAIQDYKPAGAAPDFSFTLGIATSTFGFSPKGNDVVSRYLDDGSANCGTGSNQTAGACWDGLSTAPVTIDSRSSDNQAAGTVTTLNFRAASGSQNVQPNGVYTATTTITVVAL